MISKDALEVPLMITFPLWHILISAQSHSRSRWAQPPDVMVSGLCYWNAFLCVTKLDETFLPCENLLHG